MAHLGHDRFDDLGAVIADDSYADAGVVRRHQRRATTLPTNALVAARPHGRSRRAKTEREADGELSRLRIDNRTHRTPDRGVRNLARRRLTNQR